MGLGDYLRLLREQKDWTQARVAQEINSALPGIKLCNGDQVSKWEREEKTPELPSLVALSRVFGVTLDDLVGRMDFKT